MAFKFIAVLALASIASAGHLAVAPAYADYSSYRYPAYNVAAAPVPTLVKSVAPAYVKAVAAPVLRQVEYDAPAKYDFAYGVSDPHTGDVKEQTESRDGHNVHGSYSLIDADGFKRTVEYTADEHNGFNAVVRREPIGHAAKVVAPVHYAAPAAQYASYSPVSYAPAVAKVVSPVHYSPASYAAVAPVAKVVAPVAHYNPAPVYHH